MPIKELFSLCGFLQVSELKNYKIKPAKMVFKSYFTYQDNFSITVTRFLNELYEDLIVWGDNEIYLKIIIYTPQQQYVYFSIKNGYPFCDNIECKIDLTDPNNYELSHFINCYMAKEDRVPCISLIDYYDTMFNPLLKCLDVMGINKSIKSKLSTIELGVSKEISIDGFLLRTHKYSKNKILITHLPSQMSLLFDENLLTVSLSNEDDDVEASSLSFSLFINHRAFISHFTMMTKYLLENYYDTAVDNINDFIAIKEMEAI